MESTEALAKTVLSLEQFPLQFCPGNVDNRENKNNTREASLAGHERQPLVRIRENSLEEGRIVQISGV